MPPKAALEAVKKSITPLKDYEIKAGKAWPPQMGPIEHLVFMGEKFVEILTPWRKRKVRKLKWIKSF